jgi:hypothetical protein
VVLADTDQYGSKFTSHFPVSCIFAVSDLELRRFRVIERHLY